MTAIQKNGNSRTFGAANLLQNNIDLSVTDVWDSRTPVHWTQRLDSSQTSNGILEVFRTWIACAMSGEEEEDIIAPSDFSVLGYTDKSTDNVGSGWN